MRTIVILFRLRSLTNCPRVGFESTFDVCLLAARVFPVRAAQDQYDDCVATCEDVLRNDGKTVKALFRRARGVRARICRGAVRRHHRRTGCVQACCVVLGVLLC